MNLTRNRDIDRMRGLTVFLMLVVNSPVDLRITYSTLSHCDWAGLTLADTVFPTFLFIVGVSLSLSNRVNRKTLSAIIVRSSVLIAAGLLLKLVVFCLYNQEHFKFMGVLQRIGICYAVVGIMHHYMNVKHLKIICLVLLTGWSLALMLSGEYNQYANISDVVDNSILSVHANFYDVDTDRYGDSEGILSTIGALVTTLSGVIFGEQIDKLSDRRIFCYGAVCIMAGLTLYYVFSMPVIKKIWTPSFLLICTGISIGLYLLLKNLGRIINLSYLEYPGKHSLGIYIWSILAFDILLYFHLWHSLFVMVYTYLIPRGIPIQSATLCFSLLFSSILCFMPQVVSKSMFLVKRVMQ